METNKLEGAALDWAVAKCENHQYRCPWLLEQQGYVAWQSYERGWGNPTPDYSTNWSQGGPIIEREKIVVTPIGRPISPLNLWSASVEHAGVDSIWVDGPTPLIAAMRCYVTSKLSDKVDVPKELK